MTNEIYYKSFALLLNSSRASHRPFRAFRSAAAAAPYQPDLAQHRQRGLFQRPRADVQPDRRMNTTKMFGRHALAPDVFANRGRAAPAADHPDVPSRFLNHLSQADLIVLMAARDDH